MQHDKVEFRQKLDFGQLISYFFDFVKVNWKDFSNIFLRYNGWFMLIFIGLSYLMVSGYFGIISGIGIYTENNNTDSYAAMAGFGVILYLLMLLLVGAVNYGLSSAYMSVYFNRDNTEIPIDGKEVWRLLKKRSGSLAVFMILLVLLFIGWFILFVIVNFIPVLGFFVGYAILFMLVAWAGVSCMAMIHEDLGPADALGVGWNLVMSSFWKCVGINFVMGLIIGFLRIAILSIPMIIAGVVFYHAVNEQSAQMTDSIVTIIWTLLLSIATLVSIYAQAISQFMNAGLYLSLQETKTNTFLRTKIEQIGVGE